MKNTYVQIYDVALVKLSRGMWAKVDRESIPLIQSARWYARKAHRTFYAVSDTRIKGERMHRTILGTQGDHANNNGLDNRSSNLRPCSTQQNGFNKRLRSDNACGFKGVSRTKTKNRKGNKWRAYISIGGKQINLGAFRTRTQAHEAYCDAAKLLHGEFANMGKP